MGFVITTRGRVLSALMAMEDHGGGAGVTAYALAKFTGIARTTCLYHLTRMEDSGDVIRVHDKGRGNVPYTVKYFVAVSDED